MKVSLFKLDEKENWEFITDKCTDTNGRVKDLLLQTTQSNKGVYKLKFHVSSYFADRNVLSIFPFIEVVFEITEDNHYHVPFTLSPFGYSTYRGS